MKKISVIVPVYKVEPFLDRCIQSIVDQTYANLEIILVDDGSPDNCGVICDFWSERDARIKVIHQKNGGGGQARNVALHIASGDYIAFVDSDDYLAPDMYQHLYDLLSDGADIAECCYLEVSDNNADFGVRSNNVTSYSPVDAMRCHIRDEFFRQLIWNKLFSRNVIQDIRFPIDKKIDDEFWTYQVLGNAKKLVRSDRICYAYRQQAQSVMHSINTANRIQAVEAKAQRHHYIKEHFPALESDSIRNLWFTCLYQGQLVLSKMDKNDCQMALNYIKTLLLRHPITNIQISTYSLKEKLWLTAAGKAFVCTCKLRNLLNIGL